LLSWEEEEGMSMEVKIWANSGDSHLMEPLDLFSKNLRAVQAERMPRSVLDPDGKFETIFVDGREFRRKVPFAKRPMVDPETGLSVLERAPGSNDMRLRLKDLNREGVWAELVYTSIGMWMHSIRDPELMAAGCRVINDWAIEYQKFSPRYVCTAMVPVLSVESAVAEIDRAAGMGFKIVSLPVAPTVDGPDWHQEVWHPLWAALADAGMHVGFHVGSDPHEADTFNGVYFRGPGGHLLNYYQASYGGQRAALKMIASGVFERHPALKAIVSEGGATWGPFLADRMDEAYRQHVNQVWPKFSRLPSEFLFHNVYASFQHDRSAPLAMTAMGWNNVCWGSDYPHIEGTFGHTQKTLHELFDDMDPQPRHRITKGAFQELFPHVPPAPEDGAVLPDEH
jgi:predicted TIM-barrel fold metal-dependent hydrolase